MIQRVSFPYECGGLILAALPSLLRGPGWRAATGASLFSAPFAALLRIVGDRRIVAPRVTMDWHFCTGAGSLNNACFEEIVGEGLHDEAYPTLGEPVRDFINRYLTANETVLVVLGPPGAGKTRLVRAILGELSRRKGDASAPGPLLRGRPHTLADSSRSRTAGFETLPGRSRARECGNWYGVADRCAELLGGQCVQGLRQGLMMS